MKVRPKMMRKTGHQRSMKEGLLCALMLRFSVSVQIVNEKAVAGLEADPLRG